MILCAAATKPIKTLPVFHFGWPEPTHPIRASESKEEEVREAVTIPRFILWSSRWTHQTHRETLNNDNDRFFLTAFPAFPCRQNLVGRPKRESRGQGELLLEFGLFGKERWRGEELLAGRPALLVLKREEKPGSQTKPCRPAGSRSVRPLAVLMNRLHAAAPGFSCCRTATKAWVAGRGAVPFFFLPALVQTTLAHCPIV